MNGELIISKDDIEVIEYKILKYLYESIKAGYRAALNEVAWHCELFDITRDYWLYIMHDLIERELVSGLKYVDAKDMESVLEVGAFAITQAGREYLKENSLMQKVKSLLGVAFEITLGGVIGRL